MQTPQAQRRVFDPRSGALQYKAPDPGEFDWPELRAAVADMDRLAEDHRKTAAKVRELDDSKREAEEKDRQAFAESLRSGAKDPGSKNAEKLEAEIVQATRRRDALKVALGEQAKAIDAVIAEHRAEWRQEVGAEIPETRARLEVAVREVESLRGELAKLGELQSWLAEPGAQASQQAAKNTNVYVQGGIQPRGREATLASILQEARGA